MVSGALFFFSQAVSSLNWMQLLGLVVVVSLALYQPEPAEETMFLLEPFFFPSAITDKQFKTGK